MNPASNAPATAAPRAPRPCPACGAAMNRHAEKLVLPTTADEFAAFDVAFFGVLEEHHLCPACGAIESVRVTS